MQNIEVLSVWFLGLAAIVIGGMSMRINPSNGSAIMATFVLVAICLWIAYDYILTQRYKKKVDCNRRKYMRKINALQHRIAHSQSQYADSESESQSESDLETDLEKDLETDQQPAPRNKSTYVGLPELVETLDKQYARVEPLESEIAGYETTGDTSLCNRMKYAGIQPQMSQVIRSRFNRYSLQPYFEEELREHANREWWNSDHLDAEFHKD